MGKLNHAFLGLVFAGALLGGCGAPKGETPQTPATQPSASPSSASGQANGAPAAPKTDAGLTGKAAESAPQTDTQAPKVPKELQHAAYAYWGLDNSQPQTVKVTNRTTGQSLTGKQTLRLESVKDGVATYIARYEGLELQDVQYTVKKDGVYGKQMGSGGSSTGQLQLPADPAPGKTWKSTESYSVKNHKVSMTTTYRVVGPEKVQTAKGNLDALLVTGNGTMTLDGVPSAVTSKMWLVKGLGAVRIEMTQRTGPKGKPVLIVSEIE